MNRTVLLLYLFEYLEQFVHRLGAQHGDAQLLEVGQPLEERCSGQVTAYVQNAGTELLAHQAEAETDDILHRCQQHRYLPYSMLSIFIYFCIYGELYGVITSPCSVMELKVFNSS